MDHKLGKAAPKSANGMVVSKNNYRQSYQFRKRNCYRCGKLGHFVRDCPTKRRKNNAQFKPKNHKKYYVNQQPVTGKWTNGPTRSNFLEVNKSCNEIARKISASNLQGGFSSWPSDFSKEYSSSASDFSEDYSSSALDSLEDYSFSAFHQFEDYLSSALESSSSALDSSEAYSSSVSDLSQFSSSSASDLCVVYSSSDTDKSEVQDLNEFKECEEIQPLQCATSSIAQKASDECLQFPFGTFVNVDSLSEMIREVSKERLQFPIGTFVNVDSLSEIIREVSKECLDSAECHKVVQTMHNLSVLLLINSSFSENLSESDIQALQSVNCNISQCLVKTTDDSKSTDVSASMPDKQLVAVNSGKTEKDCYATEEKEDPVGKRFFQTSAEVFQSQMVNIEGELNLIKSEIRCLRTELQMEGLKKTHAGAHENGDIQTLANRNDVINGSRPEVNLVINENDFDYTSALVSHGGSNSLPHLNLNPTEDGESNTGANYIEQHEDIVITQYNISEEPTLKSSFSTTAHPGQPNAEAETKQIEGQFRVLQKSRSCSEFDILDPSSMNEENDSDLQDQSINFFENHTEVKKLNKDPEDSSDIIYIRDYTGNTLLEDGATTECPTKIGSPIYVHDLKNVDVMHTLVENPFLESDSSWEQILLEDGAMTQSPTKSPSPICVNELENFDSRNTLEENPCLESDSSWEQINFNEEDHI